MKMKIELHVHTRFSNDSFLPLWLLSYQCKTHRVSVVAITDHNTIQGAVSLKQKMEKKKNSNLQVIIGEEIMTTEGEIIGLFLKDEIVKGLTPEETIKKIKQQNGIVYIPHPYDEKRKKTVLSTVALERNLHQIDCIECHNGRNWSNLYGVKQEKITVAAGKVKVIGSDAHTFFEIGRNTMMIDDIELDDHDKFLSALQRGTYIKANCIKTAHRVTKLAKLLHSTSKGEFREIYRTIYRRISKRM